MIEDWPLRPWLLAVLLGLAGLLVHALIGLPQYEDVPWRAGFAAAIGFGTVALAFTLNLRRPAEAGGFAASGQNLVNLLNLNTGQGGAFFYSDADLNSGNIIMTVPMNVPGVIAIAPGVTLGVSVLAFDNYFSGNLTDTIEGMRFTPGNERYRPAGLPFDTTPAGGRSAAALQVTSVSAASSSEIGILVMHRRNADSEADIVRIR